MNAVLALLDRVKERTGVTSDYALAKKLGVTPQAILHYRSGRSVPAAEVAVLIAEILGAKPLDVIAIFETARERARKHPRSKILDLWRRYSPRLLPTVIAAVAVGTGGIDRTHASPTGPNNGDDVYIMRTRKKRAA
jgi:transcriptional regulator with XRE-family HTH domain